MKVQTRLSLFSSIAFGIVFTVLSLLVYVFYQRSAEEIVYKTLKNSAEVVGLFHFERDELDSKVFTRIARQFNSMMSRVTYQVYNSKNELYAGRKDLRLRTSVLNTIRSRDTYYFLLQGNYCYGIYYKDNQGDFVIVTKESQRGLRRQLISLLTILVVLLLVGLLAIVLLSRWLARIAYRPVTDVIREVENLSFGEGDTRIASPETKDELQDLTDTFNDLLSRISETFTIQKNFVNYVSHEFRTPLAAMMGNLEVFSMKERSSQEYEILATNLIEEIVRLREILDTLMVVANLKNNQDINNQLRIDEMAWEIVNKLSISYKKSRIHLEIEIGPEDESLLTIDAVRSQIYIALFNIVENAVKYSSPENVLIRIYKKNKTLFLSVKDRGIGIPSEQLRDISKPFFRADNTRKIQGSGIGLSIALPVLEKNHVKYEILSQVGVGTTVTLSFSN